MDRLFDLTGKVAIVTGGMGQLGIAFSVALVQRGVKVAIFDVADTPKVSDAVFAQALKDGSLQLFKTDVTSRKSIEESFKRVITSFGAPTILVNNAALDSSPNAPSEEVGPYETYPEASFDAVMDVNVKGSFLCAQVVGGYMAEQAGGSIVNISSIYGMLSPCQDIYEYRRQKGETFYKPVAYSVSKSAVLNLTRYLATYWAEKRVRVNTLTLAGVFNNQDKEFLDAYTDRIPIGRMANPDDYVGALIYLASDASCYMTGANMVVDGGWTAW